MITRDPEDLIQFLNSLVAIDRYAMAELLTVRVPCNGAMAVHRSVQVAGFGDATFIAPGTYRLGVLGVLNGYCGTIDGGIHHAWGPITAVYEEGLLVRFERTSEEAR